MLMLSRHRTSLDSSLKRPHICCRKRSQSAGPGSKAFDRPSNLNNNAPEEEDQPPPTPQPPKPTPCEVRVAQYEKPLTKGHRRNQPSKVNDNEKAERLARKRSEKRARSAVLKEKVIKMIESGHQLSEYQARKAFSVYLHCILQRLSDFDGGSNGDDNNNGQVGITTLFFDLKERINCKYFSGFLF